MNFGHFQHTPAVITVSQFYLAESSGGSCMLQLHHGFVDQLGQVLQKGFCSVYLCRAKTSHFDSSGLIAELLQYANMCSWQVCSCQWDKLSWEILTNHKSDCAAECEKAASDSHLKKAKSSFYLGSVEMTPRWRKRAVQKSWGRVSWANFPGVIL